MALRAAAPSRNAALSRLPPAKIHAQADRVGHLVLGEAHDLRGGDRRAKDAEHGTGVEASRHHRGNEIRRHPLHHLVTCREAGDELPSGGALRLRGD